MSRFGGTRLRRLLLILLMIGVTTTIVGKTKSSHLESKDNVVYQDENVRFTLVTEGVIRLEYGNFTDTPSFVAINKDYSTYPKLEKGKDYKITLGEVIEIETPKLVLRYKKDGKKFSKENLEIRAGKALTHKFVWTPGMQQKENLGGTFRTLDAMSGNRYGDKVVEMPDGLLAKDGWTLVDESDNFLFDDSDWNWVKERENKTGYDWYFMAYGHDYKSALKDFTVFAGRIPLPPRYAFGYWWSRYWAYTDKELRELIENFERYDIPLDVLVIDMDWHYTEPGLGGWTGWTWNKRLFPAPDKFLKFLNEKDLKVTLNLHPADGVSYYEEKYPEMAADLGVDPTTKERIEWLASDKNFMKAIFKNILDPMQDKGVSFWWLDWQQWPYDKKVVGLNNTWWINYCFFTHMQKSRNERPMLYHRWGGLGNHRYQIGFSGDAFINWESLDYQIYFNSTASNVLYGYWSHDIGGHMSGLVKPELYTRWMQFGSVAPIMRTHSSKDYKIKKEPWNFDTKYCTILVNTIRERYEMVPYIYTMARSAYENGVSLCRPMYYNYPEDERAYSYKNEYMFGDNMIIAPITSPKEADAEVSEIKVWLPEGNSWYEWRTGTLLEGGQEVVRNFTMEEYPIYVKEGSILPLYNKAEIHNLKSNDDQIIVDVFPGKSGSFEMYEDNGDDKNYADEYAITPLSYERNGNTLNVTIGKRVGSYAHMPKHRDFTVKVEVSAIPNRVTVNGKEVDYRYDGTELALYVDIPVTKCSKSKNVVIEYSSELECNNKAFFNADKANEERTLSLANGYISKFRRTYRAILNLKNRLDFFPGVNLKEDLAFMGVAGERITYFPESLAEYIAKFDSCYARLPQILKEQEFAEQECEIFLKEVGWEK